MDVQSRIKSVLRLWQKLFLEFLKLAISLPKHQAFRVKNNYYFHLPVPQK